MREVVYLVVNSYGVRRMTKRRPDLGRTEIAIKLSVAIPDTCFRSAIIGAEVEVPAERVIEPACSVEVEAEPEPEAA